MNQFISNIFLVVLGYGFLVNLVGFKMGTYIILIHFGISLNYFFGFYFRRRFVKKLLRKKDKRMSFLRGVF